SMHPLITQQLAQGRIRDQLATAERYRRFHAARPRVGVSEWVRTLFGAVRRNGVRLWRDTEEAQRHLIARNRPWESDGPLRWQRRAGGWELHGHDAPDAPAHVVDLTDSGDETVAPEDARA
ncbi:MAG TPA: hypothetical protein VG708_10145, partial [Mycobacteriales bacterium]|nr:hypothetical protein [Mycobacteriales bacterium]